MIKLLTDVKNRNFRRLWMAQLISQFGDRIHQMALIGFITARAPGSALALAKIMSFTIIPVFIIQPFAGVFVDRWDKRRILFICDIVRGIIIFTIPFIFIYWHSLIPMYIIVFLVFTFSRFYVPAKLAIIPELVDKKDLLKANSLVNITAMMAFAIGFAVGGFLIDAVGAQYGFVWDAITFLVSGLLIFSIRVPKRLDEKKQPKKSLISLEKSVIQEMKEGFVYLLKHKEIRFVVDMLFVSLAAAGAVYVVIVIFIQQAFSSVTKDIGILGVGLCAGLFTGSVIYGKTGHKWPWYKTIFACLIVGGVMLCVFALVIERYPNILLASLLAFTFGFILGPIFIAANTIVHHVCHEDMRGKVFSALEMIIHFSFLVAMLISSWASDYIPRVWILVGVGVIFACIGLMGIFKSAKDHGLALPIEDVA